MPIDAHPKRIKGRTPEEISQDQKEQAHKLKAAKAANVPAKVAASVPAAMPPDTRTDIEKYLDEVAPTTIAGQLVKFGGKDGKFLIVESGEEVNPDQDYIALCDESLVGWIKFNGDGEPPTRGPGSAVPRLYPATARKPRRHGRARLAGRSVWRSRGSVESATVCCVARAKDREPLYLYHRLPDRKKRRYCSA
jgi:hypothetical protein